MSLTGLMRGKESVECVIKKSHGEFESTFRIINLFSNIAFMARPFDIAFVFIQYF